MREKLRSLIQERELCSSFLKNFPKRYYVVLLLFISDFLKAYISSSPVLVIAELTNDRKVVVNNETKIIPAHFNWTPAERGLALGAHAIGPLLSTFSGTVVHKVGGANFLALGMVGVGLLSLIDPYVMGIHVYLFTAARLAFGFFEGFTFIGNTDIMARWFPPNERVRALAFMYLGYGLGHSLNFPIAGSIIKHFGWTSVFYTFGVIDLIWCLVWMMFVSKDPSTDKFISEKERKYLAEKIDISSSKKTEIPYKEIFTSLPVYALLNDLFVAFTFHSFLKFLPLYVKDLYDADVQLVGIISCIPQLTSLITQPIYAYLADYLRSSGYEVGKLHKWFLFWGKSLTMVFYFLSSIGCYFGLGIIGCIMCITLAQICFSISLVSYSAIIIDMAGQYAGFMQSVAIIVTSFAGFSNPIILGFLVQNHTQAEWSTYFLFLTFLVTYSLIVFLIFGSGNLQPWAKNKPKTEANEADNNELSHNESRSYESSRL